MWVMKKGKSSIFSRWAERGGERERKKLIEKNCIIKLTSKRRERESRSLDSFCFAILIIIRYIHISFFFGGSCLLLLLLLGSFWSVFRSDGRQKKAKRARERESVVNLVCVHLLNISPQVLMWKIGWKSFFLFVISLFTSQPKNFPSSARTRVVPTRANNTFGSDESSTHALHVSSSPCREIDIVVGSAREATSGWGEREAREEKNRRKESNERKERKREKNFSRARWF